MSLRTSTITNDQKLSVLEALIATEEMSLKRYGKPVRQERVVALRCLAGEVRARADAKQEKALADLEERLEAVLGSLQGPHYGQGQLAQLGLTVIQHWPVLRQALELFKQGETT